MSGSTFKDYVRADITGTFINTDEFADDHTIDGKAMHVIIDSNELIERQVATGQTHNDGIYSAHILIYVPVAEYGPKPKLGKLLILDNRRTYQITNVIDEDGIYSMELEASRS